MAYTRKTWVNKEDIPESELGQHPRFDADNMNRIEGGIEEAHNSVGEHTHTKEDVGLGNVPNVTTDNQTPTITQANNLENLAQGDNLKTLFGKIKKAITDLASHLNNKSNPHGVSVSSIGAAPSSHAHTNYDDHISNKSNPHGVTIANIGAAPAYTYDTTDLTAGSSSLETGKLYFVYD